ncbi:MAG: DNA-binding protein WhiA, partial [Candidatus Subteraquimicrobiales bacterium]|nr:DNA-binding protein WhiA [Candidatus Subteraquimicrobiales bacterium]
VNNEEMALSLVSLLFQFNLKARVNSRYKDSAGKESFAVYLKSSDQIAQLLALVGAYEALFKWEDARIIKGLRVEVNRLVNCDTANLNKLVKAALSQMMDITLIEEEVGLSNLPKGLKEIARARTKYPQVSIKELGEVFEPPLSKSAVYHRIRRLGKLAEDLRKKAG